MSKIISFFSGLKKSTRITLISCGFFILLTFIILMFFIFFPITPSEKIMANIGREAVSRNEGSADPLLTAMPGVVTTSSTDESAVTTKITTTSSVRTTSRTSFTIHVTTGSGFLWGGNIPTGIMPYGGDTTTTAVDPAEAQIPNTDQPSTYDPGYYEPTTLPTEYPWDPGETTTYPPYVEDPTQGYDPGNYDPDPTQPFVPDTGGGDISGGGDVSGGDASIDPGYAALN